MAAGERAGRVAGLNRTGDGLVVIVVLLAGATLLWLALGRDSPRRLSAREKASDALSFLFGISPRTRRRG